MIADKVVELTHNHVEIFHLNLVIFYIILTIIILNLPCVPDKRVTDGLLTPFGNIIFIIVE